MLKKKRHIINILLVVLAVIMTVSLIDIVPAKADQNSYKVVYTVKQLKKAMKAKAPDTIVFRTEIYGDITIPYVKNAKNKDIILFAEHADVKNKAKFSSVSIRKVNHYTEAVSGNNIYWDLNYYTDLTVAKGKTVNSLTYMNWNGFMPDYTLRKGAKIKNLIFKCFDEESTYDPENRTVSMSAYNLYADYAYPNKAVYTLDKSGRIIKNEYSLSNDGANCIETLKYDKNGNLIEAAGMEEGIETYTSIYEFDKNNNKIKAFSANPGSEGLLYEYTYNKNGKLDSYYQVNSDGTITNKLVFTYDKKGRCLTSEYIKIGAKEKITYDSAGRLIERRNSYKDIITTTKFEYDKNGLLIKEIEEDNEGVYIKEYSVDHLGNRIFKVSKYISAVSDDDKISGTVTFLNECLNEYRVYEDGFFSPVKANENDRDTAENLGLIIVSNEKELIEAIAPGASIMIEPGYYNLSSYVEKQDIDDFNNSHKYVQLKKTFDGYEIVIKDADYLWINGSNTFDGLETELVIDPRDSAVFRFEDCYNLKLNNFTCGHTEAGECEGNVIDLYNCQNVGLYDMELYGCGVYGIGAYDMSGDIRVYNTYIHNCSLGAFDLSGIADKVTFNNCIFDWSYSGGSLWTRIEDAKVMFKKCYFGENETKSLYGDLVMNFEDCIWYK